MAALSDSNDGDEIDTVKFVHPYGVGFHSAELDPDVHDPRWQRRQVDDLLSAGRFELGLGRAIPGEALVALGRDLGADELGRAWVEGLELVNLALTERDFTFDGQFVRQEARLFAREVIPVLRERNASVA